MQAASTPRPRTRAPQQRPFDRLALFLPALLLGASACASDGADEVEPVAEAPFVVSSPVYTPDAQVPATYLVDELAMPGKVDPGTGYELGMDYVFALPEPRSYVALEAVGAGSIATRYRVNDSGVPVEEGRWSAGNLGATWLQGFVSIAPDKAYTFTGAPNAVIEFDPQSMTITDTVLLTDLRRPEWPDGWISTFTGVAMRDGKIFFTMVQRDETEGTKSPETEVVVFDTETNSYEVIRDDRCAATEVFRYGDDLWIASGGFDAGYHFMGTGPVGQQPDYPAPCVLRIRAGTTTFDPNWRKDFSTWTGDRIAGAIVVVDERTAYTKVLDPELVPDEAVFYWEAVYADAWTWWRFDPSSDEPGAPVGTDLPGFGYIETFEAGGSRWGFTYVGDQDESTTYRFDVDGLTPGATFQGVIFNGTRVLGLSQPSLAFDTSMSIVTPRKKKG